MPGHQLFIKLPCSARALHEKVAFHAIAKTPKGLPDVSGTGCSVPPDRSSHDQDSLAAGIGSDTIDARQIGIVAALDPLEQADRKAHGIEDGNRDRRIETLLPDARDKLLQALRPRFITLQAVF